MVMRRWLTSKYTDRVFQKFYTSEALKSWLWRSWDPGGACLILFRASNPNMEHAFLNVWLRLPLRLRT